MKNSIKSFFKALLPICLIVSCAEPQDFTQFDNFEITPVVEGSILYVESPENIINAIDNINFITQDFNFDAFSEDFVAERTIEALVTYEVENTTSKEFTITVEFLDEADSVLDTEIFAVDAAPTFILRREIPYGGASGRSIDIIRNTSSLRVSAENRSGNSSISPLPDPKIILRTSAKLRIRLK